MSLERFRHRVDSADTLATLIGTPSELVLRKQLAALDKHMERFISEAPFALIATAGRDGRCDVSPRGDTPSVARVLDPSTLVIAERPGNRRADSMQNIIDTGRIGLLFVIPGIGETLRVNGSACLFRDEEVLALLSVKGEQPVVGIAVEIEECYLQCAKALIRSKLWDAATHKDSSSRPCYAEVLIDQTGIQDESVESLQQRIEDSYAKRLY